MSEQNITPKVACDPIQEVPADLKSLTALNASLDIARISDTDGGLIAAAAKIRILADHIADQRRSI
ncbi:MAG: hypothetical protein GXP02_10095 [Alphaproteobacteria bacterium]|nr:hypothetical protein [Alphaproteobacteria bacterium]